MPDRDELAVFSDDLIAEVAAEYGRDAERLADLAGRLQSNVSDGGGVDEMVYEWRNQFHLDPLLAQTEAAYYLAVPGHIWDEFDDALSTGDADPAALRALHDRQARRAAAEVGFDAERLDADAAIVLVR